MVKVLTVWQVLVLDSDESFLFGNENENNSIKNNRALSRCRKSLWCLADIFAVINDELHPYLRSRLQKFINPVGLDWNTVPVLGVYGLS